MTDTLEADVGNLIFGDLPQEAPEAVEQAAEQPQAQPDPTPAQEPAQVEPEPVIEQQPGEPRAAHHVPLSVMLDERDKAKAAKREADDLRRQVEELRASQTPQAIPDPYEDPQGYQSYVQNQVQQQAFNMRAEMSGRFAEQKYGKETVEQAIQWAQSQTADPFLGQRVQASQSPVEFVVEQYQREQFFQNRGSDPSAQQPLATTPGAAAPQPLAAQPLQKQPAPPKSLAAAPNAGGGHQAINGSVFDSIKLNLD